MIFQTAKKLMLPDWSRSLFGSRQSIIEPIVKGRVQLSMGRIHKFIASLLTAFWLVTLGHGPLESLAFASPNNDCIPCAATEGASPLTAHSCSTPDQNDRCELRRNGIERVQVAFRSLAAVSPLQQIRQRSFAPVIPLVGEAFLLQQRWQFVWRTADSPRAPSFLA